MNEPKFVTKEELDKRKEIIDKDKLTLESIREQRNKLKSRLANVNSDLLILHSDKLKKEKGDLDIELKEVEDKMNYYISDIAESEKILKKDKKDYNEYNKWKHQQELQILTLPTADRQNEVWTEDELIELCDCSNDDNEMAATAIKLHRTYYGIEHFIRAKEYFIKYKKLPKENNGCAYSKLLLEIFNRRLR